MLLPRPEQHLEVDGELKPLATLLRKGTAVAVDLCLAVAIGAVGFAVVSLFTPLDGPGAKLPIAIIMGAAIVYLAWGRDQFFSPGRKLFRLRLARLPGPVPGLLGRSVSVHIDSVPPPDGRPTAIALGILAGCTLLASAALAKSLTTTTVYGAVEAYVSAARPYAQEYREPPKLSALPRALLISKGRAYVQVGASWGARTGTLEFFLERAEPGWRVSAVRETAPSMLANYSLGIDVSELPTPP